MLSPCTDGGASWTPLTSLTSQGIYFLAIDSRDPDTIYTRISGLGVCKSMDGGANWMPVNSGPPMNPANCHATDPGTPAGIYAGAYDRSVFKSREGAKAADQDSYARPIDEADFEGDWQRLTPARRF